MKRQDFIYFFAGFLFLNSLACQLQKVQALNDSGAGKQSVDFVSNKITDEPIESFSDQSNVGAAGKNKIEIFNFKKSNGNLAVIKFYSLTRNKKWKLKQSLEFEKDDLLGIEPQIKDFNNDGLKDVTYVSNVAGRGANKVRKLFVYDRKTDKLIYIKNSEDYPNIFYNKTLNCVGAQRFYGGTATDFARIEGDVLKTFAYVETLGTTRKIYSVGKNGKEKLLRADKVSADDEFNLYKTFNPPRAYRAGELKQ